MSATPTTPGSADEQAIVWERVATSLQGELNDAYAVAHRWQDHAFDVEADNEAKDAIIARLERIRDWQAREIRALRSTNDACERTIQRQLTANGTTPHEVTSVEAFRATYPIAEVVGAVVDLQPHTDGPREYLVGRCPFHEDTHPSPSLVVRPWFAQFACQMCGAHGDALDFLRLYKERVA